MTPLQKWIAFVLIVIGVILFNFISLRLPGQLDWTAEKQYTLSGGSRSILEKIEEPVVLNFYFTRGAEGIPVQFKNYATRVEDLLRQYDQAGGDRIRLNRIDPRPDTDDEQRAIRAGIRNIPLGTGESLFFGLQAVYADQEAVIPIFTRDRESHLEYDISQLIFQVQQWEKPVLGIITGLPILGSGMPSMPGKPPQQGQEAWALISELEKTWEIIPVEGASIPPEVNVLGIIHPEPDLDEAVLYAIDQFLLSGKPAFIAVDPSSYIQRISQQQNQQQMMMGGPSPTDSDLPLLFSAYGIDYDGSRVVGDFERGRLVDPGGGRAPTFYPPLLDLRDFNRELPPTSNITELTLVEAGSFRLTEDSPLQLQPLLTTSANTGTIANSMLQFAPLDSIRDQMEPEQTIFTLAGLLRGSLPSAFPDGPPALESDDAETGSTPSRFDPEKHLDQSSGESTILLLTDTDLMADPFAVQVVNFLGTRAMQPLNDNLTFAANLIDFIGGSEDLLNLRGKGRISRPFTRIETMERIAQTRYEAELEALEAQLQNVQDRLNRLRREQQDQQLLVASPEALQAIEDFQVQEANLRAERREIRRKLREDIEGLKLSLQLVNLAVAPVMIAAFGLLFFYLRNRQRKITDPAAS